MKPFLAVPLLVLLGCTYPDEVHVGVGHRDEEFDNGSRTDDYGGQMAWVKGVWKLKAQRTLVDYSPEARLFLTEIETHGSLLTRTDTPTEVNVNLPKGEDGVIDQLAKAGKDKEGNWTPWGVVALIVLVWVWREAKRPKVTA